MIVIDSSVAFKWLVREDGSDEALALIGRPMIAPDLLMIECGDALWKRVRRGDTPAAEAAPALAALPIALTVVASAPLVADAAEIAIALNHPIYDCIFLALAERDDLPLLTADTRFHRAVAETPFAARMKIFGDHDA